MCRISSLRICSSRKFFVTAVFRLIRTGVTCGNDLENGFAEAKRGSSRPLFFNAALVHRAVYILVGS